MAGHFLDPNSPRGGLLWRTFPMLLQRVEQVHHLREKPAPLPCLPGNGFELPCRDPFADQILVVLVGNPGELLVGVAGLRMADAPGVDRSLDLDQRQCVAAAFFVRRH